MTNGNGEDDEQQPPSGVNIVIEPDKMAGVWANFAAVSHSEHEFTIDFIRMDTGNPSQGIVVARVAVSPLFITQLVDALQSNWQNYAEKALPKEVYGAQTTEEDDEPEGGEPKA